jgi:hypothetical protein
LALENTTRSAARKAVSIKGKATVLCQSGDGSPPHTNRSPILTDVAGYICVQTTEHDTTLLHSLLFNPALPYRHVGNGIRDRNSQLPFHHRGIRLASRAVGRSERMDFKERVVGEELDESVSKVVSDKMS